MVCVGGPLVGARAPRLLLSLDVLNMEAKLEELGENVFEAAVEKAAAPAGETPAACALTLRAVLEAGVAVGLDCTAIEIRIAKIEANQSVQRLLEDAAKLQLLAPSASFKNGGEFWASLAALKESGEVESSDLRAAAAAAGADTEDTFLVALLSGIPAFVRRVFQQSVAASVEVMAKQASELETMLTNYHSALDSWDTVSLSSELLLANPRHELMGPLFQRANSAIKLYFQAAEKAGTLRGGFQRALAGGCHWVALGGQGLGGPRSAAAPRTR